MREKKFTKGPWDGTRQHDSCDVTYIDGHGDGWRGPEVCTLYQNLETNKANAALISAAPELLALLEVAACPNCDGSGGYYDSFGVPEQCQWCDERNKVIAKAYGETP